MRGLPSHTAHLPLPSLSLPEISDSRAVLSVRDDCPHRATLRPLPVRDACTYKRWSFVAPSGVTRDYTLIVIIIVIVIIIIIIIIVLIIMIIIIMIIMIIISISISISIIIMIKTYSGVLLILFLFLF